LGELGNPSVPRGVKLPSAWSQQVFHRRLPADSERVEVLGEASCCICGWNASASAEPASGPIQLP